MKSNYKIFTAVFLSAIMTAAAPLTVCGAEVFSAGESFSDGTGSIPAILTDMVLPGGEIGTEYQVQLEADTDVSWSLEEGSELPAGLTLSSGGSDQRNTAEGREFQLYCTGGQWYWSFFTGTEPLCCTA